MFVSVCVSISDSTLDFLVLRFLTNLTKHILNATFAPGAGAGAGAGAGVDQKRMVRNADCNLNFFSKLLYLKSLFINYLFSLLLKSS